jgi:hypothetical protein
MLSIKFAALRNRYPELTKAFDALESWLKTNRKIKHFEPARIVWWRPDLDIFDLSIALNKMVEEGILKRSYGVRAPDQSLAVEGFFDSPEKIPPVLHGTSNYEFERNRGRLVPVYREADAQ